MRSRPINPRRSIGLNQRRRFLASLERMESRQLLTTFVVTNTADSGPGSLRQAITLSNQPHAGADNIAFSIPATASLGPNNLPVSGFDPETQTWKISLASALPTITHQVTIDGLTQAQFPVPYYYPGSSPGTPAQISSNVSKVAALNGNDAIPRLIIDGSATGGATGFVIDSSGSSLRGLIIDGFGVGVSVPNAGDVGVVIQANDIGRYPLFHVDTTTGTPLTGGAYETIGGRGNSLQGILLSSTNSTVGGVETQDANVIVGNGREGVSILPGAHGNQVVGNQIGILGPRATDAGYFILPNGSDGVRIASSSNFVGGPVDGAGNLISTNLGDGVHIIGTAAIRNNVQGNYIGVGPGGGFLIGTFVSGNAGNGVTIEDASDNQIGGTTTADRNVISGNGGDGVRIFDHSGGRASVRNLIQGNYIGITADGISVLGNAGSGVAIFAADNLVNATNIISANLRGVFLSGFDATGNLIQDNRIGTNAAGTAKLGNAQEGIRLEDGANSNTISGDAKGSQVISGNNVGILFIGQSTFANVALGNFIGTDVTGTRDLGNSLEGVRIENSPANTIGDGSATGRNLISANHSAVTITGPLAQSNGLQGNYIGTDITGTKSLGSEVDGVLINNGASGNRIGGNSKVLGNIIAFSRRDGVRIEDGSSLSNSILTNSIFANLELGINLVGPADSRSGVTPNDPGDVDNGPNAIVNFPTLTSVATSTNAKIIRGTYNGTPNAAFRIQFFSDSAPHPSGFGEGANFLGQVFATTDANGMATYSANVSNIPESGKFITATATDSGGNTSEFSSPITEIFGSVQFEMAGYTVTEGVGTVTVVATRRGGSGGLFTVDYTTVDGTARGGERYQAASGTLTFQPDQLTQSFTVTILDDGNAAPDVALELDLLNPKGPIVLGSPNMVPLTILGNQPGAVQFAMDHYAVNEAAGTATITVTRQGGAGIGSVVYSTADGTARAGTDYLPSTGVLTFNAGETVKTFTIPIVINPQIQGNVSVILRLSSPTGLVSLGSTTSAILDIVDDGVNRRGPRVVSVRAIAGPLGVAEVVVTFDEPLDPIRAVDLRNYGYSVRTAGKDGKLGTKDDRLVGIDTATYDPATFSVTLKLGFAVPKRTRLELQLDKVTDIAGAGVGISDVRGNLLDGNADGFPGGSYTARLTAQPLPQPVHHPVQRSGGHASKHPKHPAVTTAKSHPKAQSSARGRVSHQG